MWSIYIIFNKLGVAGAILQTDLSLINYLIKLMSDPLLQNLQNIITPKPLHLQSLNFERM